MLAPSTLRTLWSEAAEALLPQRCLVCRGFGAALHLHCLACLPAAPPPRCPICWAPAVAGSGPCGRCASTLPAFDGLRAPFRFAESARRAVLEAKFRGVTRLLEPLGVAAAAAVPAGWRPEAVVPVPLHPARKRRRGYNQAEVAAEAVARTLGLPLERSVLRRVRATPAQASLTAQQRGRNLRGAFAVAGTVPARVLLVDDVTTTGATFEEAARTLRAAGAEAVYALALARED